MVRLFQVELEHYEKIEGITLSLDGKANRLAAMIRGNLGAAMQGLAVVPLFAGFDLDAARPGTAAGRIFSYDVTGGNYEERGYDAIGSGSLFAKNGAEEALAQRPARRRRRPNRRRGALRRRRRRHRHRRTRPGPPALPDRLPRRPPRAPPADRRRGGRRRRARSSTATGADGRPPQNTERGSLTP